MIHNYFFLVAGIAALFFSVGHAVWGRRMILGDVRKSEMTKFSKHMLLVIWDQPTVFHFLAAIVLLIASTSSDTAAMTPLVVFIGVVTFGFFLNYIASSLLKNRAALMQIIPQAIAVVVYLDIIAAGIHG